MRADIERRARKLIVDQLNVEADKVTLEAELIDDLGADDLDKIELALCIETEFNIDCPDEDLDAIVTFGDVVNFVALKLGA